MQVVVGDDMMRQIMKMGVLVEPEAAKILEQHGEKAEQILMRLRSLEPKPFTLNSELANELLMETPNPTVLKKVNNFSSMSIVDFIAVYNERYLVMQKILLRRPELSNTTAVANAVGNCSVIGLIKKNNVVEVEDPTGVMQVQLPDGAKVFNDEVVGLKGRVENRNFIAQEIFWPDMPLKETKSILAKISIGNKGNIDFEDTITWYNVDGIIILVARLGLQRIAGFLAAKEEDAAIEILKRRHMFSPPRDTVEPVPDYLVLEATIPFVARHKNTIIVGVDPGNRAEINLETRDASVEKPI